MSIVFAEVAVVVVPAFDLLGVAMRPMLVTPGHSFRVLGGKAVIPSWYTLMFVSVLGICFMISGREMGKVAAGRVLADFVTDK